MSSFIACLALLPCGVAAFAVMVLRRSVLTAAALALATALGLWALGIFMPALPVHLGHAVTDAFILELLVGCVIFPGLLFVEETNRGGSLKALVGAIESLSLAPPRAVILITVGIGVMLESLTGYGVSMFVTIPLLLQVVGRTRAIFLALIGMSLMSWGALSLSALLGAQLAGLPPAILANAILATSGPIAAVLPLCCLLFVPGAAFKDVLYAVLAGAVLIVGIAASSHWIGVEVAGVGGGLAVIAFSSLFASSRHDLGRALANPAILPYGLLIVGVVLQKFAVPHLQAVGIAPAIESDRVAFHILTSPGIALLVVTLICLGLRRAQAHVETGPSLLHRAATRSWPALATILLFLMAARLLVEIGGIDALAVLLSQFGLYSAGALVAVLGGIGSYVTGSGITSNALFMPSAAATGESFDALVLFASLQHSGAAHTGVASFPIIAILLAALPNREDGDERTAMRMGIGLAALWLLFVIASGFVQIALIA